MSVKPLRCQVPSLEMTISTVSAVPHNFKASVDMLFSEIHFADSFNLTKKMW